MVEFGDEFILESSKTMPWLIWIQLFITILLVLLLFFGFAVFSSDPSSTVSTTAAAPPSNGRNTGPPIQPSNGIIKVEDQRARTDVGSTQEDVDGGGGGGGGGGGEEGSSVKSSIFHPCNYIGLVKQAIFKCFGLDSSSERSSNR